MQQQPQTPPPTITTDYSMQSPGNTRLASNNGSGLSFHFVSLFFNIIRCLFGFALIGIGALLLYFILSEIYYAYQDVSSNAFINTIINWITDKPLLIESTEKTSYILGHASAVIASILIACLFAGMCIRVACTFITTGFKLLVMRVL